MLKTEKQGLAASLKDFPPLQVIGVAGKYIGIDLSETGDFSQIQKSTPDFERAIENLLLENKAVAAYGGYNEKRNLYKRSALFNTAQDGERNIHMGMDLWAKAGTTVFAVLDGTVHSFNNNPGIGNYGPTIILEHHLGEYMFFTLYGHLTLESIENVGNGDVVKQGQAIGNLGTAAVNGDYAPHLHFQIIRNMGIFKGDFPGVCSPKDRDFFLENCPDPNLLLKLN